MFLTKEKVEEEIFDKIIATEIKMDELPLKPYELKHLEWGCCQNFAKIDKNNSS
jgi:hypothetical protein